MGRPDLCPRYCWLDQAILTLLWASVILIIREEFRANLGQLNPSRCHYCFRPGFQVSHHHLWRFDGFCCLLPHSYLSLLGGQASQGLQCSDYWLCFLDETGHLLQVTLLRWELKSPTAHLTWWPSSIVCVLWVLSSFLQLFVILCPNQEAWGSFNRNYPIFLSYEDFLQ